MRDRLRYRFDATMSRGAMALVAYLGLAALLLVLIGAVLYAITGGDRDGSFGERSWEALGRAVDPGTFTGDAGWQFRIVSLLITVAGLFLVSALIGLIATALDQRLSELRKGRSRVVERGHTLILGWSPSLPVVLSELAEANANQRDAVVVVMARRDKVEMEDELRGRIPAGNPTRLVCRTGDPSSPDDLAIVSPLQARSVVVLSETDAGGDAQVVKTVLSLMSLDPEGLGAPATVELVDARHADALSAATRGRVRAVVAPELVARVTAQVCHQSGLSSVVQDLLDFDGDEIYFREEPSLAGRSFLDAQLTYADATVIGLRLAGGAIRLNPAGSTVIAEGDRLIAVAADDDLFTLLSERPAPRPAVAPPNGDGHGPPLRAVVIGWNALGPRMLQELDGLAHPGSEIHVLADPGLVDPGDWPDPADFSRLEVTVTRGDTGDREGLTRILGARDLDRVVLLSYREGISPDEADARTLLTLLLVRQALDAPENRNAAASVLAELLDVRAVRLARVANPDDFLVSERLASLVIAQIAENGELAPVFDELFGAGGRDLALVPSRTYLGGGTFADAIVAASAAGDTALGLRPARAPGDPSSVASINPAKDTPVGVDDELVVLRG